MASTLSEWKAKSVTVLTCDGRLIFGTLQGYDQLQNLILKHSYEKVYSMESPMEKVDLGLFVVRGDNVAVISHCDDDEKDNDDGDDGAPMKKRRIEEEDIRAEPIKEISGNR